MNYVENFDADMNFWDLYPEFKFFQPFKDIYKKDKSRSRKDSSTMMWFIAFCYSKASKFKNLAADGIDGKHSVVGEDYCGDRNYYQKHLDILPELIEAFIEIQYTSLEKHLKTWDDLLNKRTAFLKTQDYDLGTYEDLDKMAIGTSKVYATIKGIWDELSKEDGSGVAKGGSVPSLND